MPTHYTPMTPQSRKTKSIGVPPLRIPLARLTKKHPRNKNACAPRGSASPARARLIHILSFHPSRLPRNEPPITDALTKPHCVGLEPPAHTRPHNPLGALRGHQAPAHRAHLRPRYTQYTEKAAQIYQRGFAARWRNVVSLMLLRGARAAQRYNAARPRLIMPGPNKEVYTAAAAALRMRLARLD